MLHAKNVVLFCAGGGERTRSTLVEGKRWKFEGGKKM